MKSVCVVSSQNHPVLLSICKRLDNICVDNIEDISELDTNKKYDLVVLIENSGKIDKEILKKYTVINIHPSLLPAFEGQNPLKEAFLYGVKVTGVTVYKLTPNSKKIILAQYPVIIDNYTHFDQLSAEIIKLEAELYPLVIKSVLEDKVFDIVELLSQSGNCQKNKCSGHCKNCLK